jgi:hypothetical protein
MFCPACKAEYRQGFTRCADCDIDLVYALDVEPGAARRGVGQLTDPSPDLRLIWTGNSQTYCVTLCRKLMNAGIPYQVAQVAEESYRMQMRWRYDLGVPEANYERAKELLGIEGEFEDGRASADGGDVDEVDGTESLPPDDSPPDTEVRNDAFLEPWYPEDATAEIWSQGDEDISASIEAALKESLIHCRADLEGGVHKVFVLPEDAERSRKIVREMMNGEPG